MDELPFSKKKQAKKPKKKEQPGPTRKEERAEEKTRKWEEEDSQVYEAVLERSYDWINAYHRCEWCHERPAEQMHHIVGGSHGRQTSLENVVHICEQCHFTKGHNIKRGE